MHGVTEDIQDALQEFRLQNLTNENTVTTNELRTNYIRGKAGLRVGLIRAKNIVGGGNSFWLGDKLHISEYAGRTRLQYRKDVIPKYLLDLGVDAADVTALGTTIANCTLEQWETLSDNASGSTDLSDIFPPANTALDFELRTVCNELLVQPHTDDAASGITIKQPAGGHPMIDMQGNNQGYGLLQFGDENENAKTLVYSSAADGDFHIDQLAGDIQLSASSVNLSAGCALTIDGGPISEATEQVYVDSSFSGTSDGSVLAPYSSLSTALTAKLTDGSTTTFNFKLAPGEYTGTISIDHTSQTQSFSIEGSGMNNTFIEGAASFSSATGNVLFFRDFTNTVSYTHLTLPTICSV